MQKILWEVIPVKRGRRVKESAHDTDQRTSLPIQWGALEQGWLIKESSVGQKWLDLYTTSYLAIDWRTFPRRTWPWLTLPCSVTGWGLPWKEQDYSSEHEVAPEGTDSWRLPANQPPSLQLGSKSFLEGRNLSDISVFATVVYCYQITLQSINTCSYYFRYLLLYNKQNGLKLQI